MTQTRQAFERHQHQWHTFPDPPSSLPRSDWALVFGGVAMCMSLIPNFRNFRLFSFIALVATTFTSWVSGHSCLLNGIVSKLPNGQRLNKASEEKLEGARLMR